MIDDNWFLFMLTFCLILVFVIGFVAGNYYPYRSCDSEPSPNFLQETLLNNNTIISENESVDSPLLNFNITSSVQTIAPSITIDCSFPEVDSLPVRIITEYDYVLNMSFVDFCHKFYDLGYISSVNTTLDVGVLAPAITVVNGTSIAPYDSSLNMSKLLYNGSGVEWVYQLSIPVDDFSRIIVPCIKLLNGTRICEVN